jgi:DNA-binding transcriptional regulator YhcF (GntR family)
MNQEEVVTVRPGARKGWVVSVDRSDGDLPFSTRQLALEFARAYARLRRAGTVQVVNERGILEHEERVQPAAARARES